MELSELIEDTIKYNDPRNVESFGQYLVANAILHLTKEIKYFTNPYDQKGHDEETNL